MKHLNVEIKARSTNPKLVKTMLEMQQADYRGLDTQTDTYYTVPEGRLKMREGRIENALIFYQRHDQAGPKRSDILLHKTKPDSDLKKILDQTLTVKVVVEKKRHIYFLDNVKFHLDEVTDLGTFIEIEAIDGDGSIGEERLLQQCKHYLKLFKIEDADLIECSYSDLLLQLNHANS